MSRRDIAGPFLALLLLSALPGSACAQVFIASHPQPEFSIGPLFVSASVGKPNVVGNPGALTVSVSWSLTLAPHRRAADIAQDLYLLWPGEVVGLSSSALSAAWSGRCSCVHALTNVAGRGPAVPSRSCLPGSMTFTRQTVHRFHGVLEDG